MEKEVLLAKKFIVRKLANMEKYGGAYTALRNIIRGMPDILIKSNRGQKAIQKAIKELIKEEILLTKPSTGEIHVSLNSKMKKEIENILNLI